VWGGENHISENSKEESNQINVIDYSNHLFVVRIAGKHYSVDASIIKVVLFTSLAFIDKVINLVT